MSIGKISAFLGVIIALGTVAGFASQLDKRYAKETYVSALEDRLETKIIQDRIDFLQEQIWRMEERWYKRYISDKGEEPDSMEDVVQYMFVKSEDAKKRYLKIKAEIERLEEELNARQ